jgi:hypothetical protein
VVSERFVACLGEQSASLARRFDDGIPGVFGGEATRSVAWRAGEICDELLGHHTSVGLADIRSLVVVYRDTRISGG